MAGKSTDRAELDRMKTSSEENNKKKAKTGNPDRGRMCVGHYSDTPGSAGC